MSKGNIHYIVMGSCFTLVGIFLFFTLLLSETKADDVATNFIENGKRGGAIQVKNNLPVVTDLFTQTEQEKNMLLQERQELIDRWNEIIISEPEWIHIVVKYKTLEQSDTLPNGHSIPVDYLIEEWFLVNEDKVLFQWLVR